MRDDPPKEFLLGVKWGGLAVGCGLFAVIGTLFGWLGWLLALVLVVVVVLSDAASEDLKHGKYQ